MLRLPQAKKSSSKSKKASGAKDFRNRGPLRFCLRLTRVLSYRQVWANPQAVAYEPLSTVQGPNVQSFNNEEDYTSRRKMSSQAACILLYRTSVCGRYGNKFT